MDTEKKNWKKRKEKRRMRGKERRKRRKKCTTLRELLQMRRGLRFKVAGMKQKTQSIRCSKLIWFSKSEIVLKGKSNFSWKSLGIFPLWLVVQWNWHKGLVKLSQGRYVLKIQEKVAANQLGSSAYYLEHAIIFGPKD